MVFHNFYCNNNNNNDDDDDNNNSNKQQTKQTTNPTNNNNKPNKPNKQQKTTKTKQKQQRTSMISLGSHCFLSRKFALSSKVKRLPFDTWRPFPAVFCFFLFHEKAVCYVWQMCVEILFCVLGFRVEYREANSELYNWTVGDSALGDSCFHDEGNMCDCFRNTFYWSLYDPKS